MTPFNWLEFQEQADTAIQMLSDEHPEGMVGIMNMPVSLFMSKVWDKLIHMNEVTLYEFSCSNHDCPCRSEGLGLAFTTSSVEEAERHSRTNNSPMWVSKDEVRK